MNNDIVTPTTTTTTTPVTTTTTPVVTTPIPLPTTTTTSGTNVNVGMPSNSTLSSSGNVLAQNVASIRNGEMPPNAQLLQTMEHTRQALEEAKAEGNLSSKGQILVDDARAVLDSAARMMSEKNHDQKLQRLVGNTLAASHETRTNLSGSNTTGSIPIGKGDLQFAQGEAREIYNAAKEIVIFAVRSGQFREMLMEVMDLLQTILKSTQDKLATQPDLTQPQNIANQMKNETFFTQEYQNSLFAKFKTMIMRMGSHPEYYKAVEHLFAIVDQMEEKATLMKSQAQNTTTILPTGRYEQIWCDARALLEEFSGDGSVDNFTSRVWTLQSILRDDNEARTLLWEIRTYVRDVIKQPTLLDDPVASQRGKELIDRSRWLLQGKHKQQFQDVFDAGRLILTNIQNDSARQDFAQKVAKFVSDFAYDEQGRPDLFVLQQSLNQMKSLIVPVLTKQLANLPIPKIQGSNPKYDFAIEGLLLNITDLLPDFFNVKTKTDSRVNVQKLNAQKNSAKIVMEVDQIKAFFKDVKFMYRRKKMPRIEDHGVADVDVSQGTGISLKMVWKIKSVGGQPLQLKLVRVKCNIARLVITVKQAKHKIVDKLVTKLFAGTIKRQMANAIVNNIIKSIQPLGARLNDLLRNRPTISGGMGRINNGMKSTLFSGNTGEQTSLMRAKEQINTAVNQVKDKVQEVKAQHDVNQTSTTTVTTATVLPQYTVEKHTTAFVEPITYTEKENSMKKDWNFQWYNPSTGYDSSIDKTGTIIPVQHGEDDVISNVPVDQMAAMNVSNINKVSV